MVFVPIAIVTLILASLVHANGKKRNVSPKRTLTQQQTDELITMILPTVYKDS